MAGFAAVVFVCVFALGAELISSMDPDRIIGWVAVTGEAMRGLPGRRGRTARG